MLAAVPRPIPSSRNHSTGSNSLMTCGRMRCNISAAGAAERTVWRWVAGARIRTERPVRAWFVIDDQALRRTTRRDERGDHQFRLANQLSSGQYDLVALAPSGAETR
ncbi:hypothetical protein AB0M48_05445 [Lentzea sp. NPDC051208]|uniref:hypothetical protein n=1 Tax=Lentzea sp. NPDC051208 TaxID=3154642 RepID=UPI003416777B